MKVKVLFDVAKAWTGSHLPEILLAAGAGSFVATVICASKATLKAEDILIEHQFKKDEIEEAKETQDVAVINGEPSEEDIYTEEDYKKDKITLYTQTSLKIAKTYAVPVGLGALSLACFFGAYGIMKKRYTVVVAAYNALSTSFAAYRQRVIEDKGQDADTYYLTGVKPKEITVKDEEGNKEKKKVLPTLPNGEIASPYAFKFGKYKENGEHNKLYQGERILDMAYILGQQDYLNDQLYLRCMFNKDHEVIKRGAVMLNEIRDLLGEDPTPTGAVVGNRFSNGEPGCNGFIEFNVIESTEIDPETGSEIICYWISPNVDGMIYDLLGQFEKHPFRPVTNGDD